MAFVVDEPISYKEVRMKDLPIVLHLVRVDLSSTLTLTHSSGEKSLRVTDFAKETASQVAINANPFTSDKIPVGIWQSGDNVLSSGNAKYDALGFFMKNSKLTPKIFPHQEIPPTENLILVVGGFWQILKNGIIVDFKDIYDSRSAVGFNDKYMYFMIVEGEFPLESRGATFKETAEIFLKLGCREAFMFDGGGSAAMAVNGKLCNRVLIQRTVPCIWGIKAER